MPALYRLSLIPKLSQKEVPMNANHLVSLVRVGTRLLTADVGVLSGCDSDDGIMPEVTGWPASPAPILAGVAAGGSVRKSKRQVMDSSR